MKFLHVTFSNGETYKIPRSQVADHRAGELEAERATAAWDELYTEAMSDDEVLIDWARNYMNWSDLEYFATRIKQPALIDYDAEWPNVKTICVDE